MRTGSEITQNNNVIHGGRIFENIVKRIEWEEETMHVQNS